MASSIHNIALLAKEYARDHIKKGSTQLEANSYPDINRLSLLTGMFDFREEVNYRMHSVPKEGTLEVEIESIKKYSLGNCEEMALMAFYYVLITHPHLYAEIYEITNGDHVFLVIGKKKPSVSTKFLESWDPEAYVCDPFFNRAYPVTECREKLKAYRYNIKKEGLSSDVKKLQQNKRIFIRANMLAVKTFTRKGPLLLISLKNKAGEDVGTIHYPLYDITNNIEALSDNTSLKPLEKMEEGFLSYNSISQYQGGLIYRRAKIKSITILLQSFKDTFQQTKCLYQLLNKAYLLQDNCINTTLSLTKRLHQKELVNQSIDLLRSFEKYLNDRPKSQEKCALPASEQLQEIHNTIDCLDQLKVILLSALEFSMTAKEILQKYPCHASKKAVIKEANAKLESDINSFIEYFYKVLKPTLEKRRNPIFDRITAFFTKPVIVKGANVAKQLEDLIQQYSLQIKNSSSTRSESDAMPPVFRN